MWNKNCFWSCDWTKWGEVVETAWKRYDAKPDSVAFIVKKQTRTCNRCNRVEEREL